MKTQEKHKIISLIHQQISQAFSRLEEFEKETMFGLEHTALREQLYKTLELMDVLKQTFPFFSVDFCETEKLVVEKKKNFPWFGNI